jgi:hypothetical protein
MPTAVRDLRASVPAGIELLQNFPNPFNSSTSIVFAVSGVRDQETGAGHPLPVTSLVQLAVVDVLGREVALLVNGPMSAGVHSVIWDASQQPSGTYFSILRTEGTTQVKKILLVR